MKKQLAVLLFSFSAVHADLVTVAATDKGSASMEKTIAPPLSQESPFTSYMMIEPKTRALDYSHAFEQLRKEKSSGKVFFQLISGSIISNIIDMTLMPNSTLILFRFNTTQGIKLQVVKVEEIAGLYY